MIDGQWAAGTRCEATRRGALLLGGGGGRDGREEWRGGRRAQRRLLRRGRVRLVAPLRAHWCGVAGAGAAVAAGGLVCARLGAAAAGERRAAAIAVRSAAGVRVCVRVRVVRARLAVPPHAHHLFEFLHTRNSAEIKRSPADRAAAPHRAEQSTRDNSPQIDTTRSSRRMSVRRQRDGELSDLLTID